MTAWTDAVAALAEARARGDTRAVHAAQKALDRITAQQLRDELRPEPVPLLVHVAETVARWLGRRAA